MFNYNFLISNFFIFIALLILYVLRKIFDKNISPKAVLITDIIVVLILLFTFIPNFVSFNFNNNVIKITDTSGMLTSNIIKTTSAINDNYLSTNKNYFMDIFFITGMLINLVYIIFCIIKLSFMKKTELNNSLFNSCCEKLSIKAKLYSSDSITSPLSFGIFSKKVVIPSNCINDIDINIFYHELIHHKHNDLLKNLILSLIKAFFWFNPLIYIWHKIIKLDMECFCDYSVIKLTNDPSSYGNALILAAENKQKLYKGAYMFSHKSQLKYRITKIVNYSKKHNSIKSSLIIFSFILFSALSFLTINSYAYCLKPKINAEYIKCEKYFGNYKGTLVLYDFNRDKYYIYNKTLAEKRVSPDSVYKIAIALNALENNIITKDTSLYNWNGQSYPFSSWNQNQDLNSAMKYSVNWYFQGLDEKLSLNEIQSFLNKTNYGNKALSFNKQNYWLENSLKISPIEQAEFLKKVINNDFSFKADTISTVLNSIKLNEGYYGKTGSGMVNEKITNGWFCSIIQNENSNLILIVRIENADGIKAKSIAEDFIKNENIKKA